MCDGNVESNEEETNFNEKRLRVKDKISMLLSFLLITIA